MGLGFRAYSGLGWLYSGLASGFKALWAGFRAWAYSGLVLGCRPTGLVSTLGWFSFFPLRSVSWPLLGEA